MKLGELEIWSFKFRINIDLINDNIDYIINLELYLFFIGYVYYIYNI